MGYTARNIQTKYIKKGIWESSQSFDTYDHDCSGTSEVTIWKVTVNVSNIDYLHLNYNTSNYANNWTLKFKVGSTAELTDTVTGNSTENTNIDMTGYSGEQILSITVQGSLAGAMGTLTYMHINAREA